MRGRWALTALSPAALLAFLLLVTFALPLPGWARAVVCAPAVLFLPGAAAALGLPARGRAGFVLAAVASSAAITIVGGVVVQLFTDLDRTSWSLMLVSATALAGVAAGPAGAKRLAALAGAGPKMPRGGFARAALVSAACLSITGGAVAIAREGAVEDRERARFTTLWTTAEERTQAPATGAPQRWTIGVENSEGTRARYLLRVSAGGMTAREWAIDLEPGDEWTTTVKRPRGLPSGTPVASLYDDSATLYRQVDLLPSGR